MKHWNISCLTGQGYERAGYDIAAETACKALVLWLTKPTSYLRCSPDDAQNLEVIIQHGYDHEIMDNADRTWSSEDLAIEPDTVYMHGWAHTDQEEPIEFAVHITPSKNDGTGQIPPPPPKHRTINIKTPHGAILATIHVSGDIRIRETNGVEVEIK
jgi:hypothetical protein